METFIEKRHWSKDCENVDHERNLVNGKYDDVKYIRFNITYSSGKHWILLTTLKF